MAHLRKARGRGCFVVCGWGSPDRRVSAASGEKAAGNIALTQALAKNNQLPMASAQALTYDQSRALSEYRRLHYAHLQHCSIYDALVQRQAGRAESLMREHSAVVMLGETVKHILST